VRTGTVFTQLEEVVLALDAEEGSRVLGPHRGRRVFSAGCDRVDAWQLPKEFGGAGEKYAARWICRRPWWGGPVNRTPRTHRLGKGVHRRQSLLLGGVPLRQRHRDLMAYLVVDRAAEVQNKVVTRETHRRGRIIW
jgi:hypothetical protein